MYQLVSKVWCICQMRVQNLRISESETNCFKQRSPLFFKMLLHFAGLQKRSKMASSFSTSSEFRRSDEEMDGATLNFRDSNRKRTLRSGLYRTVVKVNTLWIPESGTQSWGYLNLKGQFLSRMSLLWPV